AVNGAEVFKAELLKEDGRPQHALGCFLGATNNLDCGFTAEALDETRGFVVQMLVVLIGYDAMEVAGNGAHISVDGPFVVVEDDDHAPGLRGDIVDRFEGNAVGEGRVAGDGDDMLVAAREVSGDGHAQS